MPPSAESSHRTLGPSGRSLDPTGRIGFDTLPDQLVNRALDRGFAFNVMCVGETACGKSTLIDCLFKTTFEEHQNDHDHSSEKVGIESFSADLEDGGVRLNLNVVHSVGFGDQLDRSESAQAISEYIEKQYDGYLQEELKTSRNLADHHDSRIHVCLYFISPTGHSLKSLDLAMLRELHKKVNIVPIIAKADTITKPELAEFKKVILQELQDNGIEIYRPEIDEDSPDYNSMLPFAVIASKERINVNGEQLAVRQYPWGLVEVENEQHSDFVQLREMLLRTHLERLRRRTHTSMYEAYRNKRLGEMGFTEDNGDGGAGGIRETYEQKRQEYQKELQQRETKMRQAFIEKVKQKEGQLKAAEQALTKKYEALRSKQMEEQQNLQRKLQRIEEERKSWHEKEQQQRREQEEHGKHKKDKKKKDKH